MRDLESGNSDVAIAGGIDAIQNPFAFLCFAKTQALSPTGRCRPFDAEADGIAISEGFATVVMKRLADAERDGDRIYAVIRGVGGASDGRDRSLTAPRPEGQMRALRRAYAQAGYAPSTVGLIEAHGTGTVAGDKAEIEALSRFFAEYGAERQATAVGSVKSMIGHTKAAAGVAGLIKVALALHHGVLPPTLGVTQPNPKANFAETPLYVNTEARPWPRHPDGRPRRAGVSAFGFGGTDFHVALEEYTGEYFSEPRVTVDAWPAELLVWKSDSRSRDRERGQIAAKSTRSGGRPSLADLAYSVRVERVAPARLLWRSFPTRSKTSSSNFAGSRNSWPVKVITIICRPASIFPIVRSPRTVKSRSSSRARDRNTSICAAISRSCSLTFVTVSSAPTRRLADRFDQPLSRFVFPPPTFTPEEAKARQRELTETNVAQPALGAAGVAILRLLRRLGVEPEMAAGHSYGEFVALHAAGVIRRRDALLTVGGAWTVHARGRGGRRGNHGGNRSRSRGAHSTRRSNLASRWQI